MMSIRYLVLIRTWWGDWSCASKMKDDNGANPLVSSVNSIQAINGRIMTSMRLMFCLLHEVDGGGIQFSTWCTLSPQTRDFADPSRLLHGHHGTTLSCPGLGLRITVLTQN